MAEFDAVTPDVASDRQVQEAYSIEYARRSDAVRALNAAPDWLAGLRPWELWGTFTVDPRRRRALRTLPVQRSARTRFRWSGQERISLPYDRLVFEMVHSMKEAGRSLETRIDFALAVETHKSGELHAHGLVYTGLGGLQGNEIAALHAPWYERMGYVKYEPPRSSLGVAGYVAKYMLKEDGIGGLVLSHGLTLPPASRPKIFPGRFGR